MTAVVLGPIGQAAFEKRGIDPQVPKSLGVFTGRSVADEGGEGAVVPDPQGNIICFPFIEHGQDVGCKYRGKNKRFWQRKGGRKTFWNCDALYSPAVQDQGAPLIITEGEIDALTAIDCGFQTTVSVPDGAPAVRDGEKPEDLPEIDADREKEGKFEFVYRNRDALRRVKRFIIASDNDPPGQRLAAELVRRFGAARCHFVQYPEGCKDLNEVRMQYGPDAVVRCISEAKPYPVKNVFRLADYPERGELQTYRTGWPDLDEHLRLWLGELFVVTGVPGHGKSTWLLNLCVNLARMNDWTICVASFEIPTVPMLRHKLRLATAGAVRNWNRELIAGWDAWLNQRFAFIDTDPAGDDLNEDMTLEWLLDRAADAVMRDGARVLLIDPWNEVEHARPRSETETQYANRALRMLRRFAVRYEVIVIVAVHPTKDVGKDGGRVPTLYDCEGSAAWFNKPDHGVVVDVPDPHTNETVIWVKKVRFTGTGKRGDVTLRYEPETEGYSSLGGMMPIWKASGVAA